MSWFFPWSDNIKKRSCRYLLQRYLGQFLEEKLTLDQLSVDLYNGKGSVSDVSLDVQALNELSEQHNWPIEFVDGFISEISVSIPWSSLLSESSVVQIDGLNLVIQPKERSDKGVSMFESVWSSMTSSSILIAEECLKQTSESEQPNPLEGLVVFAQTIDSILTRVKLKFVNTLIRLEYLPKSKSSGVALEFHIKYFSYFDEAGTEATPTGPTTYMSAFVTKHFILEGIRAYTNEFHVNSRTISKQVLTESVTSRDESNNNNEMNETSNVRKNAGHADAILFAKVLGHQEIRLQVKQAENISGPKINVEINFNALSIFISPRQLRTICDVVYGLVSPHLQDNSNVNQSRFPQKPMNIFDFEKIEQELIQQVSPGGNISVDNTKSLQNTTGWSSGGVADDSDEDFHPFRGSKTSDSLASSGSSSVSSYGSTNNSFQSCSKAEMFSNRQRNSKPRSKRKGNISESDINGDLNVYSMRLNFLSVVLLHQDIIMSHTPTSLPDTESIQKMKTVSLKFFAQLNSILASGYGYKDFENMKQIFIDAVCRRNHFRLMATTISLWNEEKNDTNDLEIQSILSLANIEIIECLIPNECQSPVQYIELLRFTKNRSSDNHSSSKPDIIVNFKYSTKLRRYTVPRHVDIKINFQQSTIEFDISTFDRLKDILTNLQLFYSECLNSSGTRNDYDKDSNLQNMLEDRCIEIKYDWKYYFPSLLIKFRFPIPDVRPVYNVDESPWWVRNVYDDILLVELIEVSVINTITSHQIYWNYEVNCKSFRCSFQYSKSDFPIPFIASSGNAKDAVLFSNNGDDFLYSRLVLKLYPRISYIDLEDDINMNEMKQSTLDHDSQEPSPFASKKVMRESGTQHSRSQNNEGEEIILLPGSKEEISDFIDDAKRNSRIQIDISVPGVIIQIPSKHFFEVIYNRFSNDLLLWTPKIMKPIISNDNEINVPFIKSNSRSYKAFKACKAAMSYDSDSDEEYDIENDLSEQTKKANSCEDYNSVHNKQSKLTICLFIAQGVLDIFPNARDTSGNVIPGQYGELQILFDEAHLFNVSSHKGKPNLNFVCLQVNHGSLHHSSLIPHGVGFEINPLNSYPSKHLEPVIYKTGLGGIINESAPIVGIGSGTSEDMVTLAIKVSILDKTIKNICIANSLCCGTLRYRSQNAYSNWLVQMINFFDIIDYPIPHYQPLKVVTQLYQQFINCIIDYRPLYLPYKAVISMENFNICSNITAKTSTSVLRFIAEEVSLFLSPNKTKQGNVQCQNDALHVLTDYVCVVDFGLFELSLRLTDNVDSPKIDLRASNNAFHIRTCSDSAVALMELIKYIASDGDLCYNMTDSGSDLGAQADSGLLICGSDSQRSSSSVYSSENVSSSTGLVPDLMEEAINDTASEKLNRIKLQRITETSEVFFFPDEENQVAGIFCPNQKQLSKMLAQSESDDDFEDEYCMLDHTIDNHITIHSNKAGAPEIRLLTNDTIRVVDNFFSLPVTRADVLKAPKGYPAPVARYTLREMTVVWHMYGGYDFQQLTTSARQFNDIGRDKNSSEPTVTFENNLSRYSSSDSVNTVNSTFTDSDSAIINFIFRHRHRSESSNNSYSGSPVMDKFKLPIWKTQGGIKRDHDSLMELQLNKLKFQHEVYPENTKQASRYVLLIQDVEIRDRLASSNINKFLYQYYSTARPKQSNANMVVIKATNIRPELNISNLQECCLRVSLLPLRLNIDQDSLLFLIRFITDLSDNNCHSEESTKYDNSCHAEKSPLHHHPVMNIENTQSSPSIMVQVDDGSSQFSSVQNSWPIFIRSFVFSPEVPVRIDYEGKRVDMSHGPIAGLIMGLAQLSCSELKLKRICNRHGFLGIDKLISFVLTEWLQEIKKNQLPSILGGVGPIYSLVQLFQGIRDLFWLPIEQYQKDGRIVRGLQRGANSFTTSTAMAALELTSRIVYAIQCIAETAFDIVSPGPSIRSLRYDRASARKDKRVRRYKYGQPADIREGVTTALLLVKEGFGETAQTLVRVASKEHEVKGAVGAVGGVLRQIPSTALTPIIIASQATSNVLDGVKSQLIPDARNEAALKWRNESY